VRRLLLLLLAGCGARAASGTLPVSQCLPPEARQGRVLLTRASQDRVGFCIQGAAPTCWEVDLATAGYQPADNPRGMDLERPPALRSDLDSAVNQREGRLEVCQLGACRDLPYPAGVGPDDEILAFAVDDTGDRVALVVAGRLIVGANERPAPSTPVPLRFTGERLIAGKELLDAATLEPVATLEFGTTAAPVHLGETSWAFTDKTGALAIVDVTSGKITRRVEVPGLEGEDPPLLRISPRNLALILDKERAGEVIVVDLVHGSVHQIEPMICQRSRTVTSGR
jgi:hypothetical protein